MALEMALSGLNPGLLFTWHMIYKININYLLMINKERREHLNLLLLRQVYLVKKVQQGLLGKLAELKTVHLLIDNWYVRESEKVQHQSRIQEFHESEKTSIYHHELHKKNIKKSANLQLMKYMQPAPLSWNSL